MTNRKLSTAEAEKALHQSVKLLREEANRILSIAAGLPLSRLPLDTLRAAQVLCAQQRLRHDYFGARFFRAPDWDILLEIFIAHKTDRKVSQSTLVQSIAIPETTVNTNLQRLEGRGLICREAKMEDGRRVCWQLSEEATRLLEGYLSAVSMLIPGNDAPSKNLIREGLAGES